MHVDTNAHCDTIENQKASERLDTSEKSQNTQLLVPLPIMIFTIFGFLICKIGKDRRDMAGLGR